MPRHGRLDSGKGTVTAGSTIASCGLSPNTPPPPPLTRLGRLSPAEAFARQANPSVSHLRPCHDSVSLRHASASLPLSLSQHSPVTDMAACIAAGLEVASCAGLRAGGAGAKSTRGARRSLHAAALRCCVMTGDGGWER